VRIIIGNKEYSLFEFDNDAESEMAVICNSESLFGKDSVFVDIKRRIEIYIGLSPAEVVREYQQK